MSLQPLTIIGYDQRGGLQTNKKPVWIPDQAFQRLENAYAWRDQVRKREGLKFLGRFQRNLTGQSLGNTPAGPPNTVTIADIFATIGITGENPEIRPGTLEITVGAPDTATFTDNGDGTFAVTGAGVAAGSYVNYATGEVILQFTALVGGAAITADLGYYPGLPSMGIPLREVALINEEQTIWFDTKYAYIWNGTAFQEFITGTTWDATNSDFFWATNYRGTNPQDRLFFVTDFVNDAANPMRYTDGTTWTTFAPGIGGATPTSPDNTFLFQARILIPYYGRLLALNTWEGATVGTAVNIFNRCRFSQTGNPIQATSVGPPFVGGAWRSDVFGKGGFVDAPTNEAIVGCTFLNNTLIIFFERTTWQLRYVGEYGIPFIFERIASDLGSESTFSPVLFNQSILAIGDKAIISADSNGVNRIDLDIPDQIFDFQNQNNGVKRVHGIRNYQKEVVYWNYADAQTQAAGGVPTVFPNKVLLYNYRNNTWAIFRDSVTSFGTLQLTSNITWDSETIYWDDESTTWDDVDTQSQFPLIVSGNQQGFAHFYQYSGAQGQAVVPANEQPSLSITGVALIAGVLTLTINDHNLQNGEIIYLSDLQFVDSTTRAVVSTDLNDNLYRVSINDANTIEISRWDFLNQNYYYNFSFTPDLSTSTYIGGGMATLFPNLAVQTKDFNPYLKTGSQFKMSYADFLMDLPGSYPVKEITGATNANPCEITSVGHGLITGQKINIFDVLGMTELNVGNFYTITVVDVDHFTINVDSTNFGTYTSGGNWVLLVAGMAIQLFLNTSPAISGNLFVGNKQLSTLGRLPFYGPASDIAWHRFYATCTGQFVNLLMTFDDNLMNTLATHQNDWILNAVTLWIREGGRVVF